MKVLAAKGLKCPMEGKPRTYIPDSGEPVEVSDGSTYYRRLIADGSLVLEAQDSSSAIEQKSEQKPTEKDKGGRK
ncbi:MAG: hypothetical protein FD156_1227 [Nitrospirae bacterium]|nr:MAG: hypothetical protein FD156_1227 [Nitrospirota bacterium]